MLAVVHEEPARIMHVLKKTATAAPTAMHSAGLLRTPHRHLCMALSTQHVPVCVKACEYAADLLPKSITLHLQMSYRPCLIMLPSKMKSQGPAKLGQAA